MSEANHDEPLLEQEFEIEGGDFIHAGEVSSKVKRILKDIGISQDVIRRTAIATYEAEMNVVCHAKRGIFRLAIAPDRVVMVVQDEGKGIADIDLAMKEGFSTASEEVREMGFGAGMGLPNIKKNMDVLNIETEIDKGTRVEMSILT